MQILDGYTKKQKIKIARLSNTSIEILNELVKDDDADKG